MIYFADIIMKFGTVKPKFSMFVYVICRHVLPEELGVQRIETSTQFDDLLQSGHAVILYMHGNGGTRSVSFAFCVIACKCKSLKLLALLHQ